MLVKKHLLLYLSLFSLYFANGQQISGYVYSEDKSPIPYANIFIQQLQTGTSTNDAGYYFFALDPGEYNVIFSALGYESQEIRILVEDKGTERSVILKASTLELEEITVRASKRDPAYAIIQNAIDNKKKFLQQIDTYKASIYIKAVEEVEKHKKEKTQATTSPTEETFNPEADNTLDAAEKKAEMPDINLLEMELTLNYQYPNQYKEERTAYRAYGSKLGLFVPRFGEADFNFYRNLVYVNQISEVGIISPISTTAILAYKYKLIEAILEDNQLVYKIEVIPRKNSNSTCKGYIYINDDIWNINRIDVEFYKGGLKFYDAFHLKQQYKQLEDSLWIPYRQEFTYETKEGNKQTFKGNTTIFYKDFQKDIVFPDRFFRNEVAVTTKEAYERDSSYWQEVRTEPLSENIQKMVTYRDSVEAIYNSPAYKDSLDEAFNKVTLLEIFWDGVSFRNHNKQQQWWLGSLPSSFSFEVVGGWRINPSFTYFKRWESSQRLSMSISPSVGIQNQDVQGTLYTRWFYNPHKISSISIDVGRSFQSINPYDAFLNQLRVSNYILHDALLLEHRMELFNGFFWDVHLSHSNRQSVSNLNTSSFLTELVGEAEPLDFQPYQAFITGISFSYTPAQKFMREPNRKIILGSKYPTFSILHRKGWDKAFSSDIDFDYLEFSVRQNLQLGSLGNANYSLETGKFINTQKLLFIDLKRFRQSDPLLFSNPLRSFQLLDTALATAQVFLEGHFIHHFNGSLLNNIPLVKLLNVRAAAGGGFLWVQENNFRYEEAFLGLERIFKLGVRRRLRLGVYYVAANSSRNPFNSEFKFSIDIIDTWKRNWDF